MCNLRLASCALCVQFLVANLLGSLYGTPTIGPHLTHVVKVLLDRTVMLCVHTVGFVPRLPRAFFWIPTDDQWLCDTTDTVIIHADLMRRALLGMRHDLHQDLHSVHTTVRSRLNVQKHEQVQRCNNLSTRVTYCTGHCTWFSSAGAVRGGAAASFRTAVRVQAAIAPSVDRPVWPLDPRTPLRPQSARRSHAPMAIRLTTWFSSCRLSAPENVAILRLPRKNWKVGCDRRTAKVR